MLTIAADPQHLGARIGITAVLHTWGSALTHHPHVHMIVPGGGISLDGERWISSRPAFLLPVRVLGKLFRRLFLTRLIALYDAGRLAFFGSLTPLAERRAFLRHLSPVRGKRWAVYAKPPFAGPEAVLAYLSRYTHRVAIANRRLLAFNETGVTFRYKDYRRDGADRQQIMTLGTDEFSRDSSFSIVSLQIIRAWRRRSRRRLRMGMQSSRDPARDPLCCGTRCYDTGSSSGSADPSCTLPLLNLAIASHTRVQFPEIRAPLAPAAPVIVTLAESG